MHVRLKTPLLMSPNFLEQLAETTHQKTAIMVLFQCFPVAFFNKLSPCLVHINIKGGLKWNSVILLNKREAHVMVQDMVHHYCTMSKFEASNLIPVYNLHIHWNFHMGTSEFCDGLYPFSGTVNVRYARLWHQWQDSFCWKSWFQMGLYQWSFCSLQVVMLKATILDNRNKISELL